VSLPPLVEPADELTVDEVRRYSRHLIIPDVGMTGPTHGVIGMDQAAVLERFISGFSERFSVEKNGPKQSCAVIVTAEYDPLRDEGEAYARELEQAGVSVTLHRYDGLIHGFFDLAGLGLQPDLPFRVEATYRLEDAGLRLTFRATNSGRGKLPFGFGAHPFFRVPLGERGTPEECLVSIPAARRWNGRAARTLLEGVPRSLPALAAAQTISRKAARVGFEWTSADEVYAKLEYAGPTGSFTTSW